MYTSCFGGSGGGLPRCSPFREHPWAVFRDGHGVLEVRRHGAVLRVSRPAVVGDEHARAALSHHGLYRQDEAGTEHGARAGTTEVGHLGSLVEVATDAVTDELPHYPEPSSLDDALNGRGDVAESSSCLRGGDTGV